MRLARFAFLLLLLPALALAKDAGHSVKHIINGKSFVLETGDTVRLASIQVPNVQEADTIERKGRPGEPQGEEARRALEQLVAGKTIKVQTGKNPRDRHERLLGQAYADDVWLQGAMLRKGYAMVYSFTDKPVDLIQKMLAEERAARQEKLGIWADPYFKILSPQETAQSLNRFRLVEGRVESVRKVRGNTYINFSRDWHGQFHVFISRKNADAFKQQELQALEGKAIRVRGWVNYYKAPMISLTHPGQIELP